MYRNAKSPNNTLCIVFSFAYAEKLIQMNWSDILFGIENGYFNRKVAVEYAKTIVSDEYEQELIDLLCLSPSEVDYGDLLLRRIAQLAGKVSKEDEKLVKEKFLYLTLRWLYDNKDEFDDLFMALDIIYDDFDFPKSIDFLGYVPEKELTSAGIGAMYDHWREYLDRQNKLFSPA
jgi:hypothetical protein